MRHEQALLMTLGRKLAMIEGVELALSLSEVRL